jgi:hypothetical protein
MDLTIGILNFRVGALGSTRLSDLTKPDPSVGKTVTTAKSESLAGSSSEVNSLVSFAMTESTKDIIKELNEIMENLNLGESTGHSDFSQNFSKDTAANFTIRNGSISNNIHQVCVIITEAVEDKDVADNTVGNTQINNPRSNSRKEKEKIYVSAGEWRVIM